MLLFLSSIPARKKRDLRFTTTSHLAASTQTSFQNLDNKMESLQIKQLAIHHIGPVDLSIDRAECVGITGPSGAGKTLLLRAIADMEPHTGEVCLNGIDSRSMPGPEWRRKVRMVPAESSWWFDTVGEHFNGIDKDWLEYFGFGEDVLNWDINRLSSGERQRLSIIRSFSDQPEVFLLDEPTANLDEENIIKTETFIADYLKENETMIIWISHDAAQLKRVAARVFVINNTRLEQL